MDDRMWIPVRIDAWLVAAVVLLLGLLVAAVVPLVRAPDVSDALKLLVGGMALGTVALTNGLTAPRDREAFLVELARRAPHLAADERGLRDPRRR